MNLQWLYYFAAIAETEHYTKAAEKMHVTQSNLSHAMKDLEKELGASLFEKNGRNIQLTKYGKLFLPYVQKSIHSLEDGVTTLKQYIDPNLGTIVLAGFHSVAQFSTDLMIRYQSETNRINVQFEYSSERWRLLNNKLLDGSVDLIISTKSDLPEIGRSYIGTHKLVALVPEEHPFAQKESVCLKDFHKQPFIAFDTSGQIRPQLDKLFSEQNVAPIIVTETANDTIVYGFVAAKRGVSIVPYPLMGAPFGTKIIPVSDELVQRKIYLQWNKERYMPPAAEYFKNYIIRSGNVFDQYLKFHKIM